MAARRSDVRRAAGREGVLRQVRRRPLPDRDPRQLERRARALRARLRVERRRAGIGAARRQLADPRAPDQGRLRVGGVELPLQRLRARAGARSTRWRSPISSRSSTAAARRSASTSPARRWAATSRCSACTSSRPRSPAASRCVRPVPELFDFFAAIGAAAEVITGVQAKLRHDAGGRREDERDARQAAGLHREGPAAGERRDPDQRRAAAVRGGRARVGRPFRRQHQPGGARRQHDAVEPRRDDDAHQVRASTRGSA